MQSSNDPKPSENGIFSNPPNNSETNKKEGVHIKAAVGLNEEQSFGPARVKVSGGISVEIHKPEKPSCTML